jgi:2-haloacid dehalogenase
VPRSPRRPAALAFDVFATLIDVSAMGSELARPGLDAAALAASWRRHQLEITWLLSLMERYEDFAAVTRSALDVALAEAGLEIRAEEREAALGATARLPAHGDAAAALERLAAAGVRLAVLSNGTAAMLDAVLGAAGLRARLGEIVSVDEIGVYKPAPAVYLHAAARLRLPPEEVWLVSANPFDCAGAAAAGLGVVKVERGRSFSYPFARPPDLVVSSLTELAEALSEGGS